MGTHLNCIDLSVIRSNTVCFYGEISDIFSMVDTPFIWSYVPNKGSTVFTVSIGTLKHLTILVLRIEQVQCTTCSCICKLLDDWQTV